MKKVFHNDEKTLLERLGRQLQTWVDALSFREIKSNELLVRSVEALESVLKQHGVHF